MEPFSLTDIFLTHPVVTLTQDTKCKCFKALSTIPYVASLVPLEFLLSRSHLRFVFRLRHGSGRHQELLLPKPGNLIKTFEASLYFCGNIFQVSLIKLDLNGAVSIKLVKPKPNLSSLSHLT